MRRPTKDLLYVSVQLVLFLLYFLVPPIVGWHLFNWLKLLLIVIAGFGIVISGITILQLNKNLTPFPSPVRGGTLITSGMFKWVRHPIYSGLILFFSAYAVYSGSGGKLLTALLITILFYFKSAYEESQLEKAYPLYPAYKQRTGRFFPKLPLRV
ncbi:MAG TPA: isoprenylcysteine carboxylmethyltransferase family protein [Sphingobacteriaceae bacterium]